MNQTQIECFLSICREGSLSKASQKLYLSTQAISRHIQNLEEELGILLFDRTKSGLSITEDGTRFYPYAAKWVDLYQQTIKKIDAHYGALASRFRIGISEYVDITGEISKGLSAFKFSHPSISFSGKQYLNRTLLDEINLGNLDVAIINDLQIMTGGDHAHEPFAKEDLRLFISGPLKNKESLTLGSKELAEACREIPHFSTSYGYWNTGDWEEISRRMSGALGFDFQQHIEAPNFRSAIFNLRTIPCSVVCDARFGYLKKDCDIFNLKIPADSRLCCLWHKKNENPLLPEFVRFMKDFYKDTDQSDNI